MMVDIEESDLLELIFWARRYCDGRSTYAPSQFNKIYESIKRTNPNLLEMKDQFDYTLKDKGQWWPYCQDGMYNPDTGAYDARPRNKTVQNLKKRKRIMEVFWICFFGLMGIMWLGSLILTRMVLNFLSSQCEINKHTKKELKWLISSIVTVLVGLFCLLYFLLSLSVTPYLHQLISLK